MSGRISAPHRRELAGPSSKRRHRGGGEDDDDTPIRRGGGGGGGANKEKRRRNSSSPRKRRKSASSMRQTLRNAVLPVDAELLKREVRQFGDELAQVTNKSEERKVKLDSAMREVRGLKEEKMRLEREVEQLKRDKKAMEKREMERVKTESKRCSSSNEGFFQDVLENIKEMAETSFSCSICSELFISAKVVDCGHSFCEECLEGWKKASRERGQPNCPICRTNIGKEIRNIVLDEYIEKTVENFFPEAAKKTRLEAAEERKDLKKKRVAKQRRAQPGGSQRGAQSLNFQGLNIRVLLGGSNRTINLLDEDLDSSSDEDDWNPPRDFFVSPSRSRSTSRSRSSSRSTSRSRSRSASRSSSRSRSSSPARAVDSDNEDWSDGDNGVVGPVEFDSDEDNVGPVGFHSDEDNVGEEEEEDNDEDDSSDSSEDSDEETDFDSD